MIDVLGTPGSVAGLIAMVVGTVLTAPAAREGSAGWWGLLATGALVSFIAALVSLGSDTAGGVLALIGGFAVLLGAALGWPSERTRG